VKISSKRLSSWLYTNCGKVSHEKKVPEFIKGLSPEYIRIFLEALFMGDGGFRGGELGGLTTVSKRLADDVQELLLKVGLTSSLWKRRFDRGWWRGKFYKYDPAEPIFCVGVGKRAFTKIKKPHEEYYKGEVHCVTTRNGVVFVRRNGKTCWCGNSDVPFVRRVMIDEDIRQAPIKHRCALDIEVDARKGFPVPDKAEFRVISIAIVGDDKREYFFSFEDEREMILEAYNVLNKQYSLVTAWNWKKFDGMYLINRSRKLKLKAKLFPIQDMDAMLNYKKITIWGFTGKAYKLEAVAKRHLGIDHESMKSKFDSERLWASFVGDKKELREYNVMDAKIVVMLDELLKLSEPYIDIAQQFPIMLRDAPLMSMVLETILLKETAKSSPRLVFPNREHKTANLIGGFTMQPKPGVHRGVLSLDYKSLYPTTMATFKLSPELVMLYKSWKDSGLDFNQWVERAFGRKLH
jgi:DNA polymerase elongation subunit (family B)